MDIKILGTGCANCKKLYQTTERAVAQSGVTAVIAKVVDVPSIMKYGVMSTPALVIDETVVSAGRLPDIAQVSTWLTAVAAKKYEAE
ncbi:MAG: thioredoxin family protein [Thermoleophilia bacterium]